jgi:hypothetical protein
MGPVLDVPLPIRFLAIPGFTEDERFQTPTHISELHAHSIKVFGEVPIAAEPWLSKVERTLCCGANGAVLSPWNNPKNFVVLQEDKIKKFMLRKRCRAVEFESPEPLHVVNLIAAAKTSEVFLDFVQTDSTNCDHCHYPCLMDHRSCFFRTNSGNYVTIHIE